MSSIPPNGITPEVIREAMPPYHLSPDLLAATLTTLPPPPPHATQPWRETRLTRLFQEIAALKPADAIQARMAAGLLTTRELADACVAHAHAAFEITHLCRLARTAAELMRSAATLDRTLARHQQMPVPFYGTVLHDEVDIPALAAAWAGRTPPTTKTATPTPANADAPTTGLTTAPRPPLAPQPSAPQPTVAPDAAVAPRPAAAPQPTAAPAPVDPPTAPVSPPPEPASPLPSLPQAPHHQPDASPPPPHPDPATPATQPPAPPRTRPAGPNWVYERLDQGPGWSREVLRPRTATDPAPEPAR